MVFVAMGIVFAVLGTAFAEVGITDVGKKVVVDVDMVFVFV